MPRKKPRKGAKRYKWTCPECDHTKLAPGRMALDHPLRFCLKCSGEPGRTHMVRRVCPVLDRKRAGKTKRRADRARQKRQKRASDPKEIARRLVAKYKKLESWRDDARSVTIKGIWRNGSTWETGHADITRGEIHLTLGEHEPGWHALIIHEIAHVVAWRRGLVARDLSDRHRHHGAGWRGACADAMADIMGSSWVTEWGGTPSSETKGAFHSTMVRAFWQWLDFQPGEPVAMTHKRASTQPGEPVDLTPGQAEWAEWALEGMRDHVEADDPADVGYTEPDIPTLADQKLTLAHSPELAITDLLYRLEVQAMDIEPGNRPAPAVARKIRTATNRPSTT